MGCPTQSERRSQTPRPDLNKEDKIWEEKHPHKAKGDKV